MLDLKYSMQHLLARMLHKTNPKASLKAVDGMIQDVEAYVIFPSVNEVFITNAFKIPPRCMGVYLSFPACDFVAIFFIPPRLCTSTPAPEQNFGHG